MYRVMIVDDEPPFIRIIKKLISRNSDRYEVIGEAFNGLEALELIPLVRPDVIFADIKMPGMDGITLLKSVNEQYPRILPVIVSGYKDFEYAKEALKTGALEYILKPINPALMDEVLEKLTLKLGSIYSNKEKELLLDLSSNKQVDPEETKQYFGYKGYMAAIIRTGALANRHSISILLQQDQPFEEIDFEWLNSKLRLAKFWLLDGNDQNEIIMVAAFNENDARGAKQLAEGVFTGLDNILGNVTIVYSPKFYNINQLATYLEPLGKGLNQCLVIGKSQFFDCNNLPALPETNPPIMDKATENKLLVMMESKSLKLLKSELFKLFTDWEEKSYPQVWVEKMLKQIIMLAEKHSPSISARMSLGLEQQLEEVISISTGFGELMKAVWDIIEEILAGKENNKSQEIESTKELLQKVDVYIQTNLAKTISLRSVCAVFGISQPYLSRLFRRFKNLSFNEYVTNIKIEKAKNMMSEYPDMLLKDIAEVAGFSDQYYFSKIFKFVTGINPSEYKTDCINK